jgi:hypothetical protein
MIAQLLRTNKLDVLVRSSPARALREPISVVTASEAGSRANITMAPVHRVSPVAGVSVCTFSLWFPEIR